VSKSTLEGFAPKDAAQKTKFSIVKTSQSAKNQLDPAKNKNRPKMSHTPFLHETLQLQ